MRLITEWIDILTSSNAFIPSTTTLGRNLSIVTGDESSVFTASNEASVAIKYGAKSPNAAWIEQQTRYIRCKEEK